MILSWERMRRQGCRGRVWGPEPSWPRHGWIYRHGGVCAWTCGGRRSNSGEVIGVRPGIMLVRSKGRFGGIAMIANINNTSIFYESVGEGLPLIFMHGLGGTGNVWQAQ